MEIIEVIHTLDRIQSKSKKTIQDLKWIDYLEQIIEEKTNQERQASY